MLIEVINNNCVPQKGSVYSACIDLKSAKNITVKKGTTELIPLGVKINQNFFSEQNIDKNSFDNFKKSHYLRLEPRSSLRVKGLISGSGIIDLDYGNEIALVLTNPEYNEDFNISIGDRIAQIMVCMHENEFYLNIPTTNERIGGFGSTDKPINNFK